MARKLPPEEYSQLLSLYSLQEGNLLEYLVEQSLNIHLGCESTSHSLGFVTLNGKQVEVQLTSTSYEGDWIEEPQEVEE